MDRGIAMKRIGKLVLGIGKKKLEKNIWATVYNKDGVTKVVVKFNMDKDKLRMGANGIINISEYMGEHHNKLRAFLTIMEEKGYIFKERENPKFNTVNIFVVRDFEEFEGIMQALRSVVTRKFRTHIFTGIDKNEILTHELMKKI
jgi:hypothetical protein